MKDTDYSSPHTFHQFTVSKWRTYSIHLPTKVTGHFLSVEVQPENVGYLRSKNRNGDTTRKPDNYRIRE